MIFSRSSAALQKVDEHMEVFELPVRSVTSSCCHCLAKLAKLSATPPIKTTTAQRPGRLKAKRKLKIQRHQSSSNVNNANGKPNLISDLKPDDLPQVDGFCCGHAYLKLSDEKGCACLCPQCIGNACAKKGSDFVQCTCKYYTKLQLKVNCRTRLHQPIQPKFVSDFDHVSQEL